MPGLQQHQQSPRQSQPQEDQSKQRQEREHEHEREEQQQRQQQQAKKKAKNKKKGRKKSGKRKKGAGRKGEGEEEEQDQQQQLLSYLAVGARSLQDSRKRRPHRLEISIAIAILASFNGSHSSLAIAGLLPYLYRACPVSADF